MGILKKRTKVTSNPPILKVAKKEKKMSKVIYTSSPDTGGWDGVNISTKAKALVEGTVNKLSQKQTITHYSVYVENNELFLVYSVDHVERKKRVNNINILPKHGPCVTEHGWGNCYDGGVDYEPHICLRSEAEKILQEYVKNALQQE